jgi:peptidoglycan/xylan/chitin deacetylase (PgdA/CDA1 family)
MNPAGPQPHARGARGRRLAALLPLMAVASAVAVVLGGCAAAVPPVPAVPAAAGPPHLVVSLTFDDGDRTQYLARPILLDHGMQATFYVNSGVIDRADGSTMTWDEVRALAADGNDIGGHTLTHPVLLNLGAAAQQREICLDRTRLLAEGLRPTDFAYPDGELDPALEGIVRPCGYRSARTAGDVTLAGPTHAERIPPADPYATAALATPSSGPLEGAYLRAAVESAAAHGGGWLQIVLHRVCQASRPDYQRCLTSEGPVDVGVFSDFVDWLEYRAPAGTVVRPVDALVAPQ